MLDGADDEMTRNWDTSFTMNKVKFNSIEVHCLQVVLYSSYYSIILIYHELHVRIVEHII